MTEMNLICEEDYKIGLLGTIIFFGFMLSSVTLMPTADILGRKPVLIATATISTLSVFFLMFVQNMTYVYIGLFFFGFTALVRGTTSYVYVIELAPEHLEKTYVMILTAAEKIIIMFIPLLFYIFRDWKYNLSLYLLVSATCTIYLFWIPESPKFLKEHTKLPDSSEAVQEKR